MNYWCLLLSVCFTLRVNSQDSNIDRTQNLIKLPVIAFNAFPNDDVAAFVLFEEGRLNRIPYGEYLQEDITLEANDDYLLEFRQRLSEGMQNVQHIILISYHCFLQRWYWTTQPMGL